VAERNAEWGEACVKEMNDLRLDVRFVLTDVSDVDSVLALADDVAANGMLWGLVNNAGLADAVGGKRFHELSCEEWDAVMTVNARGPWLVARALVPQMIAAGRGRIINFASDSAIYGSPRLAHYVASKGAVIALTRGMARELGDDGITVNALAPGLTVGPSSERIPQERHDLYSRNRAITRPQQPDDILGAVLFLLSDDAAFVTGHTLVVDGGFVMH
jgi:NAD(P)-dependent dehydrogenase (short-subunit alcohol dehydrogenase family)